jgi:hypothetical protein
VAANSLVSRITSQTCQCWRMPLRAKPISPISQVNVTARMKRAYCERGGICPQRISPGSRAPFSIGTSIAVTATIAKSTASTW